MQTLHIYIVYMFKLKYSFKIPREFQRNEQHPCKSKEVKSKHTENIFYDKQKLWQSQKFGRLCKDLKFSLLYRFTQVIHSMMSF